MYPQQKEVVISNKKIAEILESDSFTRLRSAESRHLRSGCMIGVTPQSGSYPYIPRNPSEMIRGFLALKAIFKNPVDTFLDAGSGFGNILLMADLTKLAKHCVGIEIDKTTVDISKKVAKDRPKIKLIPEDIFTYKKYNKSNIIYYFCPFNNWLLEVYFEELVEDEASIGTVIIPKFKCSTVIDKDERFTRTVLNVTIKEHIKKTNRNNHFSFGFYTKVAMGLRKHSNLVTYSKLIRRLLYEVTLGKAVPEKYKKIIDGVKVMGYVQ